MPPKQQLNRQIQALEQEGSRLRATMNAYIAANNLLIQRMQWMAWEMARMRLRLARVSWPWHRRLRIYLKNCLRRYRVEIMPRSWFQQPLKPNKENPE